MMVKLHEPTFGVEEIIAACEQMATTNVTMGSKVREFEEMCAARFGAGHCVMVNSGSSANLLALAALSNPEFGSPENRLMPGDEVIVPALSWATSVWPIIQHGAIPVFVDCDMDTYNINVRKLEEAITEKTKAIMLVHVYGNPCNMGRIREIAHRKNLWIIEDCCEAMGALYNGHGVGTFHHFSTMSLYFSHHITTLEGGLVFTHSSKTADLLRILRAHGWSREADDKQKYADEHPSIDPRFLFVNIGYNLRPTEVAAAIGMKQLPKLDGIIAARVGTHDLYRAKLEKYSRYLQFQSEEPNSSASWFGFGIVLTDNCPFLLKDITSYLQEREIETRPIIAGNMARHPALKMFEHRVSGDLKNCDKIMQNGFAIGCHQAVTNEQVEYVVKTIGDFITQYLHEYASEGV